MIINDVDTFSCCSWPVLYLLMSNTYSSLLPSFVCLFVLANGKVPGVGREKGRGRGRHRQTCSWEGEHLPNFSFGLSAFYFELRSNLHILGKVLCPT